MGERVFVDADVLFSRTLRDWLFLLRNETTGGMYTVGSTEDVLAEVIARVRDRNPRAAGGTPVRVLREATGRGRLNGCAAERGVS